MLPRFLRGRSSFLSSLRSHRLQSTQTPPPAPKSNSVDSAKNATLEAAAATSFKSSARGWRKYAHRFREAPVSHIVSFAILHEITAIAPIFGIYYLLQYTGLSFPIPDDLIEKGNRFISKIRARFNFEPLDPQSRVMVNLVTAYGLVKLGVGVRIAACFALTPAFARWVVIPVNKGIGRLFISGGGRI